MFHNRSYILLFVTVHDDHPKIWPRRKGLPVRPSRDSYKWDRSILLTRRIMVPLPFFSHHLRTIPWGVPLVQVVGFTFSFREFSYFGSLIFFVLLLESYSGYIYFLQRIHFRCFVGWYKNSRIFIYSCNNYPYPSHLYLLLFHFSTFVFVSVRGWPPLLLHDSWLVILLKLRDWVPRSLWVGVCSFIFW